MIYLLPKIKELRQDGLLAADEGSSEALNWMYGFLNDVVTVMDHVTWWVALLALGLWGLFEWRFKGENKAYIRLSVLGSVGVGLTLVVMVMAASMVIPFLLSMPGLKRPAVPPWVTRQVTSIDEKIAQLAAAKDRQDWVSAGRCATEAAQLLRTLGDGPGLAALLRPNEGPSQDELTKAWKASWEALAKVPDAIQGQETKRLEEILEQLRWEFEPIRNQAIRPDK